MERSTQEGPTPHCSEFGDAHFKWGYSTRAVQKLRGRLGFCPKSKDPNETQDNEQQRTTFDWLKHEHSFAASRLSALMLHSREGRLFAKVIKLRFFMGKQGVPQNDRALRFRGNRETIVFGIPAERDTPRLGKEGPSWATRAIWWWRSSSNSDVSQTLKLSQLKFLFECWKGFCCAVFLFL